MKGRAPASAAVLVAILPFGLAGAAPADEATAAWAMVTIDDRIEHAGEPTRWRYVVNLQWRHSNRGAGSEQYVAQSTVGVDLGPKASLWAGYGRFVSDPDNGRTYFENRYWQQFAWQAARWDRATLSLRTGLEQRQLQYGDDVAWRVRQQVQLQAPVTKRLTLVASVEPMINLRDTDWGARRGLDVVRYYLGARVPVTQRVSLESAYMYQFINRPGADNAANHVGIVNLKISFR